MKAKFLFLLIFCIQQLVFSQFDPQIGYGSQFAILKDSSIIKSWATNCSLILGTQDISNANAPLVSIGTASNALGKAGTDGVVSLGDGGSAILQFAKPISNGAGADFAVFENGFTIQNLGNAFLELAFVEVSSDGIHYFRFPSISNTDTLVQIATYGTLDARKINNLAGKYVFGYGTPFDLEELKTISGLDVNQITHVKIIDVVGSIQNEYATKDSRGTKVNDPWPTDFPSAGFDLDAVAVIHEANVSSISSFANSKFDVYPNPIASGETLAINLKSNDLISDIQLIDGLGNSVVSAKNEMGFTLQNIAAGMYFLHFNVGENHYYQKIMVK